MLLLWFYVYVAVSHLFGRLFSVQVNKCVKFACYSGIDKTHVTSLTFAARERVIPIAGGAMLTGEDGMSH